MILLGSLRTEPMRQLIRNKMRPCVTNPRGDEATLFFQEELVAAIHGAFEVAVEIAVREVKTRLSQATSDMYEELRQENESLRQKLQRAEALLDGRGDSGSPHKKQVYCSTTKRTDRPHHLKQTSPKPAVSSVNGCTGESPPPAGHSGAHQPQHRSNSDVGSDASSDEQNEAFTKEPPHACVVKVEQMIPPCPDPGAQLCDSPPCTSMLEQVSVKQERLEDEEVQRDGSPCCFGSIKIEDFAIDHMSAAQSKMLEDWKPDVLDIQSPNTPADHPADPPSSLPPPTDLPSPSSDFPNVFQSAEPVSMPEAPSQVYGVYPRTVRSRSHSHSHSHTAATLYTCKLCSQTFHLPSLLRRHYGHCKQRLLQRCPQPIPGSKRTRLQLYAPGCSPFRCTECNREFNRMENLKTHLRIHTGERPYTCSVCSKCFRHSGALTRHFRIHTGEKPYICGQCGKSFRNCGGLKFHQRSHSNKLQ